MNQAITAETIFMLSEQLSIVEKIRLIELIAPQITRELTVQKSGSRKSLRGLWAKSNLTAEKIDANRREMWSSFPREDI